MRRKTIAIIVSLLTSSLGSAGAQAARIGRLPVLAPPPATGGTCRHDSVNAELRSAGIVRLISFSMEDSSSHRLQSVAIDRNGAVLFLSSMMGTRQARRGETETVSVFFDASGRVVNGKRSGFTTGLPTRLSDDRSDVALLRADTAAAIALARALRLRCDK